MFSDRELQWLEENKQAAIDADSWDSFCASQGPLGGHYKKFLARERQAEKEAYEVKV